MNSKDDLKRLVERLKDITGLSQQELSERAGYKMRSLTQAISKDEGHDAVIRHSTLMFKDFLDSAALDETTKGSSLEKEEFKKRDETFINEVKRIGLTVEELVRRVGIDREYIKVS